MANQTPWSILWQPRKAIQSIVTAKNKPSIFLPCLLGIFSQMALLLSIFGGQISLAPWITLVLMFTVAIFFFVVHLQLATVFFDMSANALGGEGKADNVFSAYCWSYLTEIFFLPFLAMSLYGIVTSGNSLALLNPTFMAVLVFTLMIWRLAIFTVSYASVKSLPLIKAAIPVLIALVVVLVVLFWMPTAFTA